MERDFSPNLRPKKRQATMAKETPTAAQLLQLMQLQQQFQEQLRYHIKTSEARLERILQVQVQQASTSKKAPIFQGKEDEDLELWIFSTEECYA